MTKKDKRTELIDTLSKKSLGNHLLREEGEGRWFCGNPSTGTYHFRIISAPRCVFMYGDLGEAVLITPETDALRWLKKSIDQRDYVLGKSKWASKDRKGWLSQDLWHYHALKKFCELLGE